LPVDKLSFLAIIISVIMIDKSTLAIDWTSTGGQDERED
jgi:hypothetical protein